MTTNAEKETLVDIATASGGLGVLLIQLSVITGLLPALLLALVAGAILALPVLAIGLVVAVVAVPLHLIRRGVSSGP